MGKSIYPIVGMKFRGPEAEQIVRALRPGDSVRLVRDKNNQYDANAVAAHVGAMHVGFIPAPMAAKLGPRMDTHGIMALDGAFVATSDRRPAVEIEEQDQ